MVALESNLREYPSQESRRPEFRAHQLTPNSQSKIDFSYSWAAYQAKDGFPGAQATMCLVESALNITYLYLLSSSKGGDAHITAALVGFTSMVMIESKTALYWLIEAFNGMKHIGQ